METSKGKYNRNAFVDNSMKYTPTKRVELGIKLANVFNRKQYIEASITGFNYQYYSMPLRGCEIQFYIKCSL